MARVTMLAYHTIRAPAEYRSRDLPVPRRALYHWATDLLLHVPLPVSTIVSTVDSDLEAWTEYGVSVALYTDQVANGIGPYSIWGTVQTLESGIN